VEVAIIKGATTIMIIGHQNSLIIRIIGTTITAKEISQEQTINTLAPLSNPIIITRHHFKTKINSVVNNNTKVN